ncbi:DUF6350 family protein [Bifidobacterium avesanii]|uniref:Uncharacterized protein n=1 Tax=Bifidobacterium avesanii TaxID=1798157 RepID=A0A7K3TFH6_9BIFI|nr:DUF6350 family protein [Bifidobacterium avesanii]KAB8295443.1 hypothetical protein DSM100685_0053 [Bifidobacterium avesanii]NEG77449.1 hypothetical protein [Bifidobacterium avesanii]
MRKALKSLGEGAVASLLAIAIYAAALGCFIALMLLVVSMEEGGTTLSDATVPLTEAMVLLSQGTGFSSGPITLTIMPLLLTVTLVALIATLAARMGTSPAGFVAGLAVWVGANQYLSGGTRSIALLDPASAIAGKTALVFTIGYLLAALPRARAVRTLRDQMRQEISAQVRRTVARGLAMAFLIVAVLVLASLITVIVWVVLGYDAVGSLFTQLNMGTGSRITTTVAALAWLPNLMLWALSWLAGAGFSIGDIAAFTLWSGEGAGLPPLPVFGLLPGPVANETLRTALMAMPFAASFLIGLAFILLRPGFGLLAHFRGKAGQSGAAGKADAADSPVSRRDALQLAYPAGGSCLAAALASLALTVAFALSNGSLGTGRLAHVGVDVVAATQMVGHGVALGLLAAWLVALVGVAAYFGIRWIMSRRVPSTISANDSKEEQG